MRYSRTVGRPDLPRTYRELEIESRKKPKMINRQTVGMSADDPLGLNYEGDANTTRSGPGFTNHWTIMIHDRQMTQPNGSWSPD